MGGEGSMMAANQSLKNNRGQLSKRKDRKALSGSYANIELKTFPKATEAQLKNIKKRLQEEHKQTKYKAAFIFAAILVVMALIITLI